MTVETQNNVDQKIPETPQNPQVAVADSKTQPVPNQETESVNERNWREFRKKREEERKAKEESDRRAAEEAARAAKAEEERNALKAVLETVINKPAYQVEEKDESEEDRIQKQIQAQVNAAIEANEKRRLEEQKKREVQEIPNRLVQSFPDFNNVCTKENLDYLEYHYPEVYAGYKNSAENFETWAGVYKAIKRFVPNLDGKKEAARIEKNLNRPQSMSQHGMSTTGDVAPIKSADERYKQNWSRMQRVLKGLK